MAWDYNVINLDEAITRAMGRKELYKGWLDSFFKDESFTHVSDAFEKKDYEAVGAALHKIKGTAGNLSVLTVFKQAGELDAKIKNEPSFDSLAEDLEKLREYFYAAKKMYTDNINVLTNYGELSF